MLNLNHLINPCFMIWSKSGAFIFSPLYFCHVKFSKEIIYMITDGINVGRDITDMVLAILINSFMNLQNCCLVPAVHDLAITLKIMAHFPINKSRKIILYKHFNVSLQSRMWLIVLQ